MARLTPEQWNQASPYLDDALGLTEQERVLWLAAFREKNPTVAELLEALLAEHRAAAEEGFLEQSPPLPPTPTAAGDTIGAYQLLSPVGHGGMGTVWLAERCDGRFQRKVAVKFPHIAVHGDAGQQRFRREGNILGRLAHPNIAELVDAGVSSSGQPYLVLEYVDGEPIDRYSDQHNLSIEARLRLFLDVLSAVAHAHTNLIVHRDIKPSNVLVTAGGQVKLLDFGIAKLLEEQSQGGEATLLTQQGGAALTPAYAAPEQITGHPVTTATDVYSLGVLLYVLLSGHHPVASDTRSTADLVKAIVEIEPPRPSDALTSVDGSVAAARSTTLDKLRRQFRGDLDTIVSKTLKKSPGERYGSAAALASDVSHHLRHEPISARPDTIAYRARKFVRRNRVVVALTTLALVAVISGAVIATRQARIAQRRFQELHKLAHTVVFDLHDEIAKLEGSTTARELLVRTGLEYLDNLSRNAGGDLRLQKEIADGYVKIGNAEGYPTTANLGRIGDALANYRKAGDIYRRLAAEDASYLPDLAKFYLDYAGLVRFTHDLKQAREMDEAGLQTLEQLRAHRRLSADTELVYISAWCRLGDIDEDMAKYHEAWSEFSHCGELAQAALNNGTDVKRLSLLSQADERVGTASQELGMLSPALRVLDDDEKVIQQLLAAEPQNPAFHRRLAVVNHYRTQIYYDDLSPNFGDPGRALSSAKRYLELTEDMVRRDPTNTSARFSRAIATYSVSFCLREFDTKAAVVMARRAVRLFDQMIASGDTDYLTVSRRVRALRRLGEAQLQAGQVQGALGTARTALEIERPIALNSSGEGEEEQAVLVQTLILAGKANAAAGQFIDAEALLQEARKKAHVIAQNPELTSLIPLANSEYALGEFYARRHRRGDARACYDRLSQLWQNFAGDNEYVEMQRSRTKELVTSLH